MNPHCTRCHLTLWESLPKPLCSLHPPSWQGGSTGCLLAFLKRSCFLPHCYPYRTIYCRFPWKEKLDLGHGLAPFCLEFTNNPYGKAGRSWMHPGNNRANVGRVSVRETFQMGERTSFLFQSPLVTICMRTASSTEKESRCSRSWPCWHRTESQHLA